MGAKRNNLKSKFLSYFKSPNGYDIQKDEKNRAHYEKRFVTKNFEHRRQSTYRQKLNLENVQKQNFPFDALITKHSANKSIPVVVHGIWSFNYAECLTEGSKTIPVMLSLEKPVMFTKINNKLTFETVHDVREYKKVEDVTWLAVTQRFLYNSKTYEPGDILEINNKSKIKNLFNSFSKNSKKNELNVVSHPKQERSSLPAHLKGNFRICESPYTSCYRLLSDLVNTIEPPFLITLPINTNTGEVMCQGKVSFTKHNKRLLVMKKSTMHILFVSQENDERIGLLNLSTRDHIEVSDCYHPESMENKENHDFDLIKQRALKHLKGIFDSKEIFHFDDKVIQLPKPTKRKSFKAGSFIKRRRSNTDTVEMRNTVNEHRKSRKEVTSLILNETTSLSHSIFKSLKRFSYHPPSDLYKAPSYKELLEKIDHYQPDDKKMSVRDRNGYLVPITGFSPEGGNVQEFVNSMEEQSKNETKSVYDDDDDNDVEVGDDGYVLVTPTKKNELPCKRKYKAKESVKKSSAGQSFVKTDNPMDLEPGNISNEKLENEKTSNFSNPSTETCCKNYVANTINQNKCLANDVNKNNVVIKQFSHSQKPQLLPKPSTVRVTSETPLHQQQKEAAQIISASYSKQNNNVHLSNTRNTKTVTVNGRIAFEKRPVVPTKRFSAIVDRFEKLSGSTDRLTYC